MNIWQLVVKEISRRKMNFSLGLVSVVIAVTTLMGALILLRAHDVRTEQIVAQKEEETKQRMVLMQDDYRKIMKKLGFNLLILPKDQQLADLYANDYASKYMPEDYVSALSASKIMSIRHLLPSLQQKIKWPEKQRTIILIGTRGEVPFLHRDPKEPMLVAVPKGTMVLGYELHQSLNLKQGDKVRFFGQDFMVHQCNEERGSKDDISIWIDLKQAQDILNRPDQVNAILALKCICAGDDISLIRKEITAILPGTQVIEQGTKVITRAEARERAAQEAEEAIGAEIQNREKLKKERETYASIMVPLVLIACGVWIFLLFLSNVRDRQSEIGIFRAIGVRASGILKIFLLKALLIGLIGGFLGFIIGIFSGIVFLDLRLVLSIVDFRFLLLAIVLSTLLSLLASWIPALLASQQDPAIVLREE
ncbi:FtsX-like permease family protein [candidate division KSB1 bacterium]|nr:FtsX-like permease family protein [candidate division KSB1 bacterium]